MNKVLAIIKVKNSEFEFTAKIFDDFNNNAHYAVNEAAYKIKISNTISFQVGDLLLIEVQNINENEGVIEGIAKKYQRSSDIETIIWME